MGKTKIVKEDSWIKQCKVFEPNQSDRGVEHKRLNTTYYKHKILHLSFKA